MKHSRLLPLVLAAALAACGAEPAAVVAHEPDGVVRTTTYPVHYLTERLAGDDLRVELVLPPGADPIFWRPERPALEALQRASLIVTNGADFERWMQAVSLPQSRILRSADGFAERHLEVEERSHSHGPTGEHSHTGVDGHTWLDPRNAEEQARAIADELRARFPEHGEAVAARMAALRDDLRALDERWRAAAPTLASANLIASHPAYDYLAERYGFAIANLDLDPDAALDGDARRSVEAVVDAARPDVLLWESEPRAETSARLAHELGVHSVVVSPAEGPPDAGGPDYLAIQHANLDALLATIGGATAGGATAGGDG